MEHAGITGIEVLAILGVTQSSPFCMGYTDLVVCIGRLGLDPEWMR